MAPVVRKEFLDKHPDVARNLEGLSALLDNEVMARLNGMIDVDKVRIARVASDFLRRNGLI